MCLALKQIHKARTQTIEQVLEQDFCIAQHVIRGQNFVEGVRALLIDKDNAPSWKPLSLEAVHEADIDLYFQPTAITKSLKVA